MIPIYNLYYMLAYAFQVLQEGAYKKCAVEAFDHAGDLLAALLVKGVTIQVRRGLGRDYKTISEPLACLKGKLELTASMRPTVRLQQKMVCSFDAFTTDCYLNRILKTTMEYLLRFDIRLEYKKRLRALLVYFEGVQRMSIDQINWNYRFNRNNQSYQMLVTICQLVIKGMIQSKQEGVLKLLDLDDNHKARLYEKFILEYYRKHHPTLNASARYVDWALEGDDDSFLPQMKTDVTLTKENKMLILDAKWYVKNMQSHYGVEKFHSHNIYQIFTYVQNKKTTDPTLEVSGMLLYAKTTDEIQPNHSKRIAGVNISVKTLDLNCPFLEIARQLDEIAESF